MNYKRVLFTGGARIDRLPYCRPRSRVSRKNPDANGDLETLSTRLTNLVHASPAVFYHEKLDVYLLELKPFDPEQYRVGENASGVTSLATQLTNRPIFLMTPIANPLADEQAESTSVVETCLPATEQKPGNELPRRGAEIASIIGGSTVIGMRGVNPERRQRKLLVRTGARVLTVAFRSLIGCCSSDAAA
jgi:hypothetical protein